MFRRIAIVNRGEAAMRLIHAVRELNAAGGDQIETVALYTDAESSAKFVRESDLGYPLGPASARPYLDYAVLERALRETGADAAWVGWGFVAEDPAFAELCERLGVTFIGPSAAAMRALGDKIGSKLLAEKVGVPVAPWSQGPVEDLRSALAKAETLGYPLMLKATAGGGGRGIRVVRSAQELTAAFNQTRDEAVRAFGSGVMFLETMLSGARHVEVQVVADGQGSAWAIGVRDCSVQRRNQKVIEESSSAVLAPAQVATLKASAERLALAVDYRGAGTVEFLYRPSDGMFAFLEVNTRLQVEHPITELTTGLDLVKIQLEVAAGGRLNGQPPAELGHAVEARLNAEDPDRDFAPAPGRIALLDLPDGPGVRVDTGFSSGDVIPADFDSMIAKIIASGRTRDEALARLRRAVADTTVIIEGGATNKSFVLDLLAEPEVIAATADTGWIDRTRAEGGLVSHQHAGIALVAAAIEANELEERAERLHFFATAHGGRPQARHKVSRAIDLSLRGTSYRVNVSQLGPNRYRVGVGQDGEVRTVDARIDRLNSYASRLEVGNQRYRVVSAVHGTINLVEVNGVTHRVSRDEGGVLRSPAPALVVAVPVSVGDEVPAGAPVLVLESMKMETVLSAPFPARVRELLVATGGQVETGTPLIRLEPAVELDGAGEGAAPEAEALVLELPTGRSGTAAARAAGCLDDLRSLLLGFDLSDDDAARTLSAYQRFRAELVSSGEAPLTAELGVFRAFADLCELSRNRPGGEEVPHERVHSPREYFHAYLHSLDVDREQLPDAFRLRLSQALTHYGIADLERTPALEEAVYRIFLAQPVAPAHLRVVTSLLQQWLLDDAPGEEIAEQVRDVLERLVAATQLRYPVVGDLARSVRFRWFDQPLVDAVRASVLAGVRDEVRYLAANPEAPDYAQRINALAAIPERIVRFLAERLEAGIGEHEPMLEVLARRHYREYELHDLRNLYAADRPFVVCDYTLDDRPTHLVTTVADLSELVPGSALATALEEQLQAAPAGHQCVLDLYVRWPEMPDSATEASAQLNAVLTKLELTRQVRRVVTAICPGSGRPVTYYTFRPQPATDADGAGQLLEDDLVRGVHPMVGRRLKMWRLKEFQVTRLDAPEDVLLYLLVAPNNEADRRLVALAQIREFAVVRDADGHVVSLPHAERAVRSCGEAIRRARASLGGTRLDMNYVALHIWPTVDAPVSELTDLQRTISPLTVGAGIEEVIAEGMVVAPDGRARNTVVRFSFQPGAGVVTSVSGRLTDWLHPLDDYAQKVLRARRRGTVYPYELVGMLTGRDGRFTECDLDSDSDAAGKLAPVQRPPGGNRAGIVVGVASTPTDRHPQGITRVVLLGDPTRALGAVAEPECARIIAALDLAEELSVPVEWFALSAGARISMDSGTENMDWVARALRRIVTFTQAGGEINVVVAGINVGAQPYWNAEATMLMHTKGILVMTPESAMVLTGKQSLDFSGGVSAEDNFGIGGYDRVMGPNGQAQYWVPNLASACEVLMSHYAHSYIAPGEGAPRLAKSSDPIERDISDYPHALADSEFRTIGDIFSPTGNPDRKKPFDIRSLMRAVADQDISVIERWAGMADAETSVVFDAHLGGRPVCLIGIESRAIPRRGFPPSDGPDLWTAGTLFPRSSKKTARAINAASGNRPVVMLANLSGFDGSPDSMRNLQLEYGAEIGRAVVNFQGPIVFCVVSRYHGGAFVVFSKALNSEMTVLAIEGSYASVLGGAPAAAVVFTGEVDARTARDPRITELQERAAAATGVERAALATELATLRGTVRVEKLAEVAAEFDAIHSIQRAVEVGSVDAVIGAHELRPRLIQALDAAGARRRARALAESGRLEAVD